jgi:tetratricopeptide (TPR) repeat protein
LLDEAITALQNADAIYKATGERANEGKALYHLALVLRKAGRVAEAVAMRQEATTIYREIESQANREGSDSQPET